MNNAFLDPSFKTPKWLAHKFSRRSMLKSAAGATAIAITPVALLRAQPSTQLNVALNSEPWLSLNAVLNHLLPASDTGPSAQELNATQYLYNVVTLQPTAPSEIEFIFKGVGWLNGYTQSQLAKKFVALTVDQKETMLRGISTSTAGDNWLNNLINYLYEAMLTPPSYGGNPNGIGWQWLDHQAGFPLPPVGKRYYELPGQSPIAISFISSDPTPAQV